MRRLRPLRLLVELLLGFLLAASAKFVLSSIWWTFTPRQQAPQQPLAVSSACSDTNLASASSPEIQAFFSNASFHLTAALSALKRLHVGDFADVAAFFVKQPASRRNGDGVEDKTQEEEEEEGWVGREDRVERREAKYFLSAMMYNRVFEGDLLNFTAYEGYQWLLYMHYAGVEHVFWYDCANDEEESQEEALQPLASTGHLTYIKFYEIFQGSARGVFFEQDNAILHFLQNYWNESEWVIFCDVDEYPFSPSDTSPSFLPRWIRQVEVAFNTTPSLRETKDALLSQILLPNVFFWGLSSLLPLSPSSPSSSLPFPRSPLLIERYQRRLINNSDFRLRTKPIVRPAHMQPLLQAQREEAETAAAAAAKADDGVHSAAVAADAAVAAAAAADAAADAADAAAAAAADADAADAADAAAAADSAAAAAAAAGATAAAAAAAAAAAHSRAWSAMRINPHEFPLDGSVWAEEGEVRLNHYWGERGNGFKEETEEFEKLLVHDASIQPIADVIKSALLGFLPTLKAQRLKKKLQAVERKMQKLQMFLSPTEDEER